MIGTILAGLVVAASMSTPPAASDAAPSPLAVRLDEIRGRFDLPALAGFAMKGGEIIAIEAVGVRARGEEAVVTIDDRWHLGSCGKAMSATVLDRLVDRGDLAWDTTIGDVFGGQDEILAAWHDVTLRRLVQHRSGLPEDRQDPVIALRMMSLETPLPDQRLELVRLALSKPPVESDGSKMRYSNFGYAIAAAMAERRTGRDWESMCRELLFEPLRMSSTDFGAPGSMESIDQPRGASWRCSDSAIAIRRQPPGDLGRGDHPRDDGGLVEVSFGASRCGAGRTRSLRRRTPAGASASTRGRRLRVGLDGASTRLGPGTDSHAQRNEHAVVRGGLDVARPGLVDGGDHE